MDSNLLEDEVDRAARRRRRARRQGAQADADRPRSDAARHRRDHRHRHLRAHRHAAAEPGRPGASCSRSSSPGLACGFAALCYAEFASMIPIAGSAYTYAYATLGEIFAWIIGWDLILEYAVGSMTVAVGWSGYFAADPRRLRPRICRVVDVGRSGRRAPGAVINLPAVLIAARDHGAAGRRRPRERALQRGDGGDQAGRGGCSSSLVGVDLREARELDARSCPTAASGRHDRRPAVVFFAYIGFDAVSTTAEEAKNPQRDLPIGIIALAGHLHAPLSDRRPAS